MVYEALWSFKVRSPLHLPGAVAPGPALRPALSALRMSALRSPPPRSATGREAAAAAAAAKGAERKERGGRGLVRAYSGRGILSASAVVSAAAAATAAGLCDVGVGSGSLLLGANGSNCGA